MGIYSYLYTETVSNVGELLQFSNDLGAKGKEGRGKRKQRSGSCDEGSVLTESLLSKPFKTSNFIRSSRHEAVIFQG